MNERMMGRRDQDREDGEKKLGMRKDGDYQLSRPFSAGLRFWQRVVNFYPGCSTDSGRRVRSGKISKYCYFSSCASFSSSSSSSSFSGIAFVLTMLTWAFLTTSVQANKEVSVVGLVGYSTKLPCDVDVDSCGEVYFITWTKNSSNEWKRLYLYSDSVAKPLQELANPNRATFKLDRVGDSHLIISPLRLEDEGTYKCDVTYVQGKCPSLSYANLVVNAQPGAPTIRKDGVNIQNATTVGPFYEGVTLTFECYSSGGKPLPEIYWNKRGSDDRGLTNTHTADKSGTFDVVSSISLNLTRFDNDRKLECLVKNEAIDTPTVSWIKFDVHVAPSSLEVQGPTTPVIASKKVWIKCIIEGAKPAANATWYNMSEIIDPQPHSRAEPADDGTFRTTSVLELTVSRYDNKVNFYCKGTNFVLQSRGHPPMLKSVALDVLYPPSVTIEPLGGIIVNESDSLTITCTYNANPPNVSGVQWYKGNQQIPVDADGGGYFGRYVVSYTDYPKLTIKNVSRSEHGNYWCSLANIAGQGNATNRVEVNVLYPPKVLATASPSVVEESESSYVSLFCEIISGNPQNLVKIRWYKDSDLMNETTEKEIKWSNVSRNFTGRYYCQGQSAAGWGVTSEAADLVVNFAPSRARLIHADTPAVKGRSAELKCSVVNLGYPPATHFRWQKDGINLKVNTTNYTIDEVTLAKQGNYSCAAVNEVGSGEEGHLELNVLAPPAFVGDLPKIFGAAADSRDISVPCRVECEPLCRIEWLKDGVELDESELYYTKSSVLPEDYDQGLFRSVVSTLYWNTTAWPNAKLNRENDSANYTCRSTKNVVGPGVSFNMMFTVEYGPENISVSKSKINVTEGDVPEKITCSCLAFPPAEYYWKYEDDVISDDAVLFINYSIPRQKRGTYTCVAKNRHGQASVDAEINVFFKPLCRIYQSENLDGDSVLICESHANPEDADFRWIKDNETVTEEVVDLGSKSVLTLPSEDSQYYGTYYCLVNNSIGISLPCRIEIQKPVGAVPDAFPDIIIIACVVAGVVLLFIVIIIVIILIMKRRRLSTGQKCSLGQRETPDGHNESSEPRVFTKSTFYDGLHNGRSPINFNPVISFKKEGEQRRRRRSVSDSSSPVKMSSGEPLYQNVSLEDKKGNGPPPVTEAENRAMYENMPFHFGKRDQKGMIHFTNKEGVVYADLALPSNGSKITSRINVPTEYATLKFAQDRHLRDSFQTRRQ